MSKTKINFGLKMLALKWAKALLKKEAKEIEERYHPISPLPEEKKVEGKSLIVTEPVKEVIKIVEVKQQTPIERAIQNLRNKANGA